MEKLKLWWKQRSSRDQRAMVILLLVLPAVLFWYLLTMPLLERREIAQRVLETRRNEAAEVQKLLHDYSLLRQQVSGIEFKASASVIPALENAFRSLPASDTRPMLNRANVMIFGRNQPAAHIVVDRAQPVEFWRILEVIASSGVYLAEFEVTASEKQNEFNSTLKAWSPEN